MSIAERVNSYVTYRWTRLRYHETQSAYWTSGCRHNVMHAGRRSGKTELLKRKIVLSALCAHRRDLPQFYRPFDDPRFFIAAPTVDQVKEIYWEDIKALIPARFFWGRPNESTLQIRLINGARIRLMGMDKPSRIEGRPWDGGGLDEYGDMKSDVWVAHVRPCLSDRMGWCDFVGVPEGRNHYYDLTKHAEELAAKAVREGVPSDWAVFHWLSADILDPGEIAAARESMDPLTFKQEYEGSFENFTGLAYYNFDAKTHCQSLDYNPVRTLLLCFDFNVSPGVAVVAQEQILPNGQTGTGIIGEVFIERNSNTIMVCDRILQDFGGHQGRVLCYGDPSGASGGSARLESDWEMIRRKLRYGFKNDVHYNVPKSAPKERDRVNSMNSRLQSVDGTVRMMVDPSRAPHVVKDFEGVVCVKGGSGELDKSPGPLTHLTDALGYYVHRQFPIGVEYKKSGKRYI